MFKTLIAFAFLLNSMAIAQPANLVLDGKLEDPFWKQGRPYTSVASSGEGTPAILAGDFQAAFRGNYLCLSARIPEPGGKVLARSFGRNPVWEKDLPHAPELEDRVVFTIRYRGVSGAMRTLNVAINPWGAYRIEENGKVLDTAEILPAALVTAEGWTVEAAIPAAVLDLDWRTKEGRVDVQVEQIRSQRALAPQYRWTATLPSIAPPSGTENFVAPELRAPLLGNTETPLEVGRVLRVPEAVADWQDPAWRDVPEFTMARNEAHPRPARHKTRVKWMHDTKTLALFFYVEEPEPVLAYASGRDDGFSSGGDGGSGGEDHVSVRLATSGSAYLEIGFSPSGAIRDAIGRGPWLMRPETNWNASIDVQAELLRGRWLVRANIPLAECAAALGEKGVPKQWRVLLSRFRAGRPGEAAELTSLPVLDGTASFHGPIRYRRMVLADVAPNVVPLPNDGSVPMPKSGLAAELASMDSNVWSLLERRHQGVRSMLPRDVNGRIEEAVLAERKAWEQVKTREQWEEFRDTRMKSLRQSLGVFPPPTTPLDVHVTARYDGDGYRLENLAYQSRPGFYVAANLYLPKVVSGKIPVILMVHSQHFPKIEAELHDSGEVWARAGAAVLIVERPGFGERTETNPWYRQAYASRFNFTQQLFLAGESLSAWTAWDVLRSVDFLMERPEIDPNRIIAIGSVASGGEVAGLAAALDPRIAAVVPFNYDQGHLRVHGDSVGQVNKQFSPWLVSASIAPRKFIRPFEFGWEAAEETDVPGLWVDSMSRSEKVWAFYNASDCLAEAQGFGFLRTSAERRSACENLGPEHREALYPTFERWFGIPFPSEKDRAIPPSSLLYVNKTREVSKQHEAQRLRPVSELVSIPPSAAQTLNRKPMHQLVLEVSKDLLRDARERRSALTPEQRVKALREDLAPSLGDIEATATVEGTALWKRPLTGVDVEAIVVRVQRNIQVPLLLLSPQNRARKGVVVGVSSNGKDRFLKGRAKEIAEILNAGFAVCLPDLRGTGETESGYSIQPYGGLPQQEMDLSQNLLGARLKDLRSVVAYLRQRGDVDAQRISVWGESFAGTNSNNLFLDEVEQEAGPELQRKSDPMGPHLAVLVGLYEEGIRAIAAQGGLSGYQSMLDSPYTYVPQDLIMWGILKAGDISDIAEALAPRPLLLQRLVDGRNVPVANETASALYAPAKAAYQQAGAANQLIVGGGSTEVVAWIIRHMR